MDIQNDDQIWSTKIYTAFRWNIRSWPRWDPYLPFLINWLGLREPFSETGLGQVGLTDSVIVLRL